MPTSSRRGRTGAGCGRCVLLGVSAFTSPSVRPRLEARAEADAAAWLGAFLHCNPLPTKQKGKLF